MSWGTNELLCDNDKFIFTEYSINKILNYVCNKSIDYEITCPVSMSNDNVNFDFDNIKIGGEINYTHKGVVKTRKMVMQHSKHTIFHTHPISSKPYPSVEDIVKLLKHRDVICNSFIFTNWGLWIISNTSKSNYYNKISEDKKNKINIELEKILNNNFYIVYKKYGNKECSSKVFGGGSSSSSQSSGESSSSSQSSGGSSSSSQSSGGLNDNSQSSESSASEELTNILNITEYIDKVCKSLSKYTSLRINFFNYYTIIKNNMTVNCA